MTTYQIPSQEAPVWGAAGEILADPLLPSFSSSEIMELK